MAIQNPKQAAGYMVDKLNGSEKGAVPRTPQEGWEDKVTQASIFYHGEVVAGCQSRGGGVGSSYGGLYGGIVNILDFCEEPIRGLPADPRRAC